MKRSYKTICPACNHNSLYVTPHNGFSYCFREVCHYMEHNGKQHIKKRERSDHVDEIRALYNKAAKYYHASLDKRARDFLLSRGFTDQTIQKLMIGYAPIGKSPLYRNKVAKEAGIASADNTAFLGDRIVFPYFKNNDTITDLRGRSLDPDEELKYLSPYGSAFYRGAIYPYNYHLAQNSKRIILTEGEIKADIAVQIGIPTIAIPGITNWRKGFIQNDNQKVIIVFDTESNPDTQLNVVAAIRKISLELYQPMIAVLPILDNDKKAEIDTFVNKYGADLFKKIIDNALTYEQWNRLQRI